MTLAISPRGKANALNTQSRNSRYAGKIVNFKNAEKEKTKFKKNELPTIFLIYFLCFILHVCMSVAIHLH